MKRNTMNAIQKRLNNGETRFYIGAYYYECTMSGFIRRREQKAGYTPTSDWERVCDWNLATWQIEQ